MLGSCLGAQMEAGRRAVVPPVNIQRHDNLFSVLAHSHTLMVILPRQTLLFAQ
eukprot:m.123551 g.123551  ORF g.123551 m.123551 type:complete len:53 (+) comp22021_c0_seq2:1389-1547(+)